MICAIPVWRLWWHRARTPTAIKERLGHSSITVTLDQYGHLLSSIDEKLPKGLDRTSRKAADAVSSPGVSVWQSGPGS